ncbi:uncharacterized protein EI90DRAFT_3018992 [Cantharellus anzutake]|uniref:uncharacterized protein n=1 Tax=Cantharellus anzutake TaxID=1750568 RepID=UPI00190785E7|nr:uncharacterized protein EI90DRAFT_3018992 [Cantharellus anzutake]KAF8325657.1 hypothetical protein EI90DRAFT_3018992 [Cantharellus anzutake]
MTNNGPTRGQGNFPRGWSKQLWDAMVPHIALNPGLSRYALWRDFHEKYPDKSPATYSCYHQRFRDDFSQAVSKYLRERRNLPAARVTLTRRPEGRSEEHPAFSKDEWAAAVRWVLTREAPSSVDENVESWREFSMENVKSVVRGTHVEGIAGTITLTYTVGS